MSFGNLLGKHTWLGVLCAWSVFLLLTALGSLLAVKGVLPLRTCGIWTAVSFGVSVFAGGRLAAQGREAPLPRALLTALLCYGTAWLAGLATGEPLRFAGCGLSMLIAAFAGGILAGLLSGSRKRKRKTKNRAYGGKSRNKAVT